MKLRRRLEKLEGKLPPPKGEEQNAKDKLRALLCRLAERAADRPPPKPPELAAEAKKL